MSDPKQGDTVTGRYELVRLVGEGGFGVVWAGRDSVTGQLVAVKFLKATDADARRRFEVETRVLMRISSPHCARPIDSGDHLRTPFIVTEYIEGASMKEWQSRRPTTADIERFALGVARGLDAAHREGVVHRDLKPDNILMRHGETDPVIVDFGIAKALGREQSDVTKTGVIVGTPGFMSPEQLRGRRDINAAADMYSLGVILYEVLEGHPPFDGDSALEICMKHLTEPAPAVARNDAGRLGGLVADLLAKDPVRRPTAAVVVATLTSVAPPTVREQAPRPLLPPDEAPPGDSPRSNVWIAAIVAVAVLALLALGMWNRVNSEPEPLDPANRKSIGSLLKSDNPEQPTPDIGSRDVGTDGDSENIGTGCPDAAPLHSGRHTLDTVDGRVEVLIPAGYSPKTRRYKLVALFHDAWESPASALSGPDLRNISRADDWVIVAPFGDPNARDGHWRRKAIRDNAFGQIASAAEELCVDADHPYVIGYGVGGHAALKYACANSPVAVATFAFRPFYANPGDQHLASSCKPERPFPLLMIAPNDDPTRPAGGGVGCGGGKQASIEEARKSVLASMGCSEKVEAKGESCTTYDCPENFEWCSIPGGRLWPSGDTHSDVATLLRIGKRCRDGAPTKFEVTKKIWDFFDDATPALAAPEEAKRCVGLPAYGSGIQSLRSTIEVELWARIPQNYDPTRPHPVLIYFHDTWPEARTMLENLDFDEPIGRDFVMLAARKDRASPVHWRRAYDRQKASNELARALETICTDDGPQLVVGHGVGGYAAILYANRSTKRSVVATHAYRINPEREPLEKTNAFPLFTTLPRDDAFEPWEGGENCFNNATEPAQQHVDGITRFWGCDTPVPLPASGDCETAACSQPIAVCSFGGNRLWPDGPPLSPVAAAMGGACGVGAATSFDVRNQIWTFYDKVRTRPQ